MFASAQAALVSKSLHGLVISQLSGHWRIGEGLYRSAALEARDLLERLRGLGWQVDLQWIPRTQNEECDTLSKKPLAAAGVPQEIQPNGS